MEINSSKSLIYELTNEGRFLGDLRYKKWGSFKARIRLTDADIYDIEPRGFWGTTIDIRRSGTEIACLTMSWRGKVLVSFEDGREYELKVKGFLNQQYYFKSKTEDQFIRYNSTFSWRKFRHNFTIEPGEQSPDSFLILLGLYAALYYITMVTAVTN